MTWPTNTPPVDLTAYVPPEKPDESSDKWITSFRLYLGDRRLWFLKTPCHPQGHSGLSCASSRHSACVRAGSREGCHRLTPAPPPRRSGRPMHRFFWSAAPRGLPAPRGISWHPSLAATVVYRFKDESFAGRGKPRPRLDDKGKVLVAAEQRQAGRQALFSDARKCLSQQYLQIQGSRFDSPRLHGRTFPA